jgi:putative solute:sodium symporter small subunit
MSRSDRDNYWRQTRLLTAGLFVIWVLVTFVMNWFARELNEIVILGFPLGFYMGAQGILIVYLLIIWIYNRRMRTLDQEYRIEDD